MREPTLPAIATPHSINLYYARLRSYQVGMLLERLFTDATQSRYSDDMPSLYRVSQIRETTNSSTASDGMSKIVAWIDETGSLSDIAAIWQRMEREYPQEARALYLRHVEAATIATIAAQEDYSTRYASKTIQRGELRLCGFVDARSYTRDRRDHALDILAALRADPDAGYDATLADD